MELHHTSISLLGYYKETRLHLSFSRKSLYDNKHLGLTIKKRMSSRHPAIYITDTDYADDLAITSDNVEDANIMLHKIEEAAAEIGLGVNADKTEYISLNQANNSCIKSLKGKFIKQVNDFKYLGSYVASTDHYVNVRIGQAWAALNNMTSIWKSNLSVKLKKNFFRATVESILVYGSITWTLTSSIEKKIDGAYTRMLRAALNKRWQDHTSNNELYVNIPKITITIK